jgi:transglutaminase-like putative cysteine protease
MYRQYIIALSKIKNSGVPYDTICYEDFIGNQIQYIANVPLQREDDITSQTSTDGDKKTVSLELPYQDLCINYYEVKEKIRKEPCLKITDLMSKNYS